MRLRQIYIFILLFCCATIQAEQEQTAYEQCLLQHGFDPLTMHDWSGAGTIVLETPSCAYINIDSVAKMPTEKGVDLHAWFTYYDEQGNYFKKRILLSAQGASTLVLWPKKNFAIDFCEDEWIGDQTTGIQIGDWVEQDAFHLKAYYIDWLRGAGNVAYQLYDDIVADHDTYVQRAGISKPKAGARCYPDGFPCMIYHNGKFYGVYAWNLKKHRDNMSMKKNNAAHIHLDGYLHNSYLWYGNINWEKFEVRNPKGLLTKMAETDSTLLAYDGNVPSELLDETSPLYDPENEAHVRTATVKKSIQQLSKLRSTMLSIQFSKDTALIRSTFEECIDITSLIDYQVFSFVTNNADGFAKNWQWFTYDGKKWFVAPYDLDMTFGNMWFGYFTMPAEWNMQGEYYNTIPTSGPCYWTKKFYMPDIKKRYAELRDSKVLDADRISTYMDEWYNRVGEENYQLEYQRWPDSYCERDLVPSPYWETSDDWKGYSSLAEFDINKTYHAGDRCRWNYRIWTATAETCGNQPVKKFGYHDSLDRFKEWIRHRLELMDEFLEYTPKDIKSGVVYPQAHNRSVEARYDMMGNRVGADYHGIVIVHYTDGSNEKVKQ